MPTRKRFELLDCPKFAYPSLTGLDVSLTAANIIERLQGKSFLNYSQIWPLLPEIVDGKIDKAAIKARLSSYRHAWKNATLQEVAGLLHDTLGSKGRWYKESSALTEVLPGAYFKSSIRGTWYHEGRAYKVGINARKGQRIFPDHARFLARGIYEFHCLFDPAETSPLIIDLSADDKGRRRLRTLKLGREEMMSLEEFESILRRFFDALELAGVTTVPEKRPSIADLFRRK